MKVFLTGAGGMLGSGAHSQLVKLGHEVYGIDIRNLSERVLYGDVRNEAFIGRAMDNFHPDLVFHFAAETDVDYCEANPDEAFEDNVRGTEIVAEAAQSHNIPIVFISSASVFDGTRPEPYTEDDEPSPGNVYAKTKRAGEHLVSTIVSKHIILRAGWMAGGWEVDKKFVAKIVHMVREGGTIHAVTDKRGSVTYTLDLIDNLLGILEAGASGLFHCVNHGYATRFDIAGHIVDVLDARRQVTIVPVDSRHFPLTAPRPDSECLHNARLKSLGLDRMPSWKTSLEQYVHRFSHILNNGKNGQ